jgi:hypothetical protein
LRSCYSTPLSSRPNCTFVLFCKFDNLASEQHSKKHRALEISRRTQKHWANNDACRSSRAPLWSTPEWSPTRITATAGPHLRSEHHHRRPRALSRPTVHSVSKPDVDPCTYPCQDTTLVCIMHLHTSCSMNPLIVLWPLTARRGIQLPLYFLNLAENAPCVAKRSRLDDATSPLTK